MSKPQASSMLCWKPKIDRIEEMEFSEEIQALFNRYSTNTHMSWDQFVKFLTENQYEIDSMELQRILDHPDHHPFQQKGLQFLDFARFLLGDHNFPLPQKVHQNMDAPLAHYFMYTRVKTNLFSDRRGLMTESKSRRNIASIVEALNKGVRVIQLDLSYISKKDGSHSSQEDLDFRAILKRYMEAINTHGFANSEYPLIISFDGAINSEIQSSVAQVVKTIFPADRLYNPKVHSQTCLSPESLKRKILIIEVQKELDETENEERAHKMKLDKDRNEEYKSLLAFDDVKLDPSLSEILSAKPDKPCCFGLTQPKLENAIKTQTDYIFKIRKFTQKNLLAVYPKDKLSGSSNCNPLTGWNHGAQMVAINTQGRDKYLGIIQGMFRGNGGCGYVKKPDILLKDGNDIHTKTSPSTNLTVKIYMGNGWDLDFSSTKFDVFSPPDFFVKVQICGVPADIAKEETSLQMNKWTPTWNEKFIFPLKVPELALLRIEVRDFDDDRSHGFAGQTCLPVWEIKKGIRAVPLYDKRGDKYKHTRLLVQFHFEKVINE